MWWSWLPVAESEPPNGGKTGDLSDCECCQLLVPDGLLVWVFHTLLLIRWDFHRVATVPGGLQFSENEKKKNARWAERNNLVEIKDRKHVPQPATRGRVEFSSQLSLGEVVSLSQCYTDRTIVTYKQFRFSDRTRRFLTATQWNDNSRHSYISTDWWRPRKICSITFLLCLSQRFAVVPWWRLNTSVVTYQGVKRCG